VAKDQPNKTQVYHVATNKAILKIQYYDANESVDLKNMPTEAEPAIMLERKFNILD
jgi:hypothetical protein